MIPVSAGASFLESLWIEDFKLCSTFLCNCPKERHRGAENNEHKLHKLMNRELGSETESTGWAAAPLQSPCKSSSSAALLSPCWDVFFFYTQISLFSLMHFSPQWLFSPVLHSDPRVPASPPRPGGRDRPGRCHLLRCPGRPSAHHNLGQGTWWWFHVTGERDGSSGGELNSSLLQHLSQLH